MVMEFLYINNMQLDYFIFDFTVITVTKFEELYFILNINIS